MCIRDRLRLVPSTPTAVTVQALEPADEAGSVSKALLIELPGPGFLSGVLPAATVGRRYHLSLIHI